MVARTAAKPTVATTAKGRTSKVAADEDIDLLSDIQENNPVQPDDDDDFDLLSDMSESDAEAWIPQSDDEQPKGIQGKVIHIGTVTQDAKYGGNDVPYWEVQDKNDPELIWGVRGYSTVLRGQMEKEQDAGLRNGDIVALAYQGLKNNRKGDNEYHNFVVRSKHIGH